MTLLLLLYCVSNSVGDFNNDRIQAPAQSASASIYPFKTHKKRDSHNSGNSITKRPNDFN